MCHFMCQILNKLNNSYIFANIMITLVHLQHQIKYSSIYINNV